MTKLTIQLPDNLAQEAKDAGLLSPDAIEAMLREYLRRDTIDSLFKTADQLSEAKFQPMTMDEIQAEVNAVRAQRQ